MARFKLLYQILRALNTLLETLERSSSSSANEVVHATVTMTVLSNKDDKGDDVIRTDIFSTVLRTPVKPKEAATTD